VDIKMGVPVEATDGRAGKVEQLVFDPAKKEVVGVVVTQGWLLPHDVVVPMDRVASADEHALRVRATVEEVSRMPAFSLSQYVTPPENWIPPAGIAVAPYLFPASPYAVGAFIPPITQAGPPVEEVENLPEGTVDLGPNQEVLCDDDVVGHVDRVITEGDSDRVTHLVVRHGTLFGHDVVVPADRITQTDGMGIHLSLTREEFDQLPRFDEAHLPGQGA
jgi:uncharacterized protein YrrD